jgi:hypothetical protein
MHLIRTSRRRVDRGGDQNTRWACVQQSGGLNVNNRSSGIVIPHQRIDDPELLIGDHKE